MTTDDLSRAAQRAREVLPPKIARLVEDELRRGGGCPQWAPYRQEYDELAAEVMSMPAPAPAVDRQTAIRALAECAFRRYESDYDADHLTWRDFADQAASDLDVLISRGLVTTGQRDGAGLIAAERRRQVEAEGMTAQHDDAYGKHQLVRAAMCYALPRGIRPMEPRLAAGAGDDRGDRYVRTPVGWPWHPDDFKSSDDDRIRELSKAGALIAAEIDRLQRDGGEQDG